MIRIWFCSTLQAFQGKSLTLVCTIVQCLLDRVNLYILYGDWCECLCKQGERGFYKIIWMDMISPVSYQTWSCLLFTCICLSVYSLALVSVIYFSFTRTLQCIPALDWSRWIGRYVNVYCVPCTYLYTVVNATQVNEQDDYYYYCHYTYYCIMPLSIIVLLS